MKKEKLMDDFQVSGVRVGINSAIYSNGESRRRILFGVPLGCPSGVVKLIVACIDLGFSRALN